jgi:hypothetical protein
MGGLQVATCLEEPYKWPMCQGKGGSCTCLGALPSSIGLHFTSLWILFY